MTSTIIIDPMETDGPKCQRVLFDNDWLGERIWPIYKLDYDGPEIEDGDESGLSEKRDILLTKEDGDDS